MNYQYLNALNKILEDFQSININVYLALASDPENPKIEKTIVRIREILEASIMNFELLDFQCDEYRLIVKEMRMEEIYKPVFGESILNRDLNSIENIMELLCLHKSLIDFRDLLKASLEIS